MTFTIGLVTKQGFTDIKVRAIHKFPFNGNRVFNLGRKFAMFMIFFVEMIFLAYNIFPFQTFDVHGTRVPYIRQLYNN